MRRLITIPRRNYAPCRVYEESWFNEELHRKAEERDLCRSRTLLHKYHRGLELTPNDRKELDLQLKAHRDHRVQDVRAEIARYQRQIQGIDDRHKELTKQQELFPKEFTLLEAKRKELFTKMSQLENLGSEEIMDRNLLKEED